MEKPCLKSPCYTCIKSEENKKECAPKCKKLKEYQDSIKPCRYEDLKGSAFEIYTMVNV